MPRLATIALLLSGSILFSHWAESQSTAADGSSDQILFLQVHLEKGRMTITKSTLVPGVLKTLRGTPNRTVMFSVESTNGTALWSGWMDDPSIQRLEYPDDSQPGAMRSKILTNDPGDFVVRVPQISGADKLSFYRLTPASAQTANPAIAGATTNSQTPGTVKELMGSVALPGN